MIKSALYSTVAAACILSAPAYTAPLVVGSGQTFNNTAPLVVDGHSINDGTVNNFDDLENNNGTFDNNNILNNTDKFWQRHGVFNNNSGSLVLNSGRFDVYGDLNNKAGGIVTGSGHLGLFGAIVVNDGTISSNGTISDYYTETTNNGLYSNAGTYGRHSSTFSNSTGAVFSNGGQFRNEDFSHFNNSGVANNTGTLENSYYANFTNKTGAIFNNSGTLGNSDFSTFTNEVGAILNNTGTLTNTALYPGNEATIINHGTVQNTNDFTNAGTFDNENQFLNSGTFTSAGSLSNEGSITNNGSFESDGGYNQFDGTFINELGANAKFGGTWSNWSFGNGTNNFGIANSGTLTTEGDGLNYGVILNHRDMSVEGTIDNHGEITNDGTLTNNGSLLRGLVVNKNGGILTNNGTLGTEPSNIQNHTGGQLINNGSLHVFNLNNDGGVTNAGDMTVGTVDGFGNFLQTSGSLMVDGTMSQSSIVVEGGLLGGIGTINGPVTVSTSTIGPGNSPGILTVNGDLDILTGTIVTIELGGLVPGVPIELGGLDPEAGYDQLDIYGTASLAAGTVFDIGLYGGFNPLIGDTFDILLADAIGLGSLSSLTFDLPTLNGRLWDTSIVSVNGSREALRLSVEPVPVPPTLVLSISGLLATAWAAQSRRRRRPVNGRGS